MKRAIGLFLVLGVFSLTCGSASAQHVHSVPHTTTHNDTYRHGSHYHNVPHTTTHYDNVLHYGPDYVPHTTTHVDAVRHAGHVDYVPHTTTHLHQTYPGSGVFLNPGERIISSTPVISSGSVISSTPVISSSGVVTQPPPATLSSSTINSSSTVRVLKPNMVPYTGRGVKIMMPREIDASVNYLIDGSQDGEIRSGEEQMLKQKGSYEIRFSRGETPEGRDLGEARYTITEGSYRFGVTEKGWDLFREKELDAASMVAPSLNRSPRKNALPSLPVAEPAPLPIGNL